MLKLEELDIVDFERAYKMALLDVERQKFINENLRQIIRYYQKQLFGSSSDKIDQKGLFNEAELEDPKEKDPEESTEEPTAVGGHTRKKPIRKPLPEHLPRKEIIYDLSAEDKMCACCSQEMHKIGEETSEQLDIIPAKIEVIRHIRYKYTCRGCDGSIKKATMPPQAIPKSNAGPGLLAHLIVSKYEDALPLYRQEKIFKRIGVDISRGVMASWVMKIAELVQPLLNLMREDLIGSEVINCDETTVRVLKKDGLKAAGNSYMWVMGSWRNDRNTILFEYDSTRSSEVPVRLFSGFKGYLQADGYDAYNAVTKIAPILRVGCFAHVRRKFTDCIKTMRLKDRKNHSAFHAIGFIKKLYAIEDQIKLASKDEKKDVRERKAIPILDEFKIWLDLEILAIPPKTAYGRALAYANNEWEYLIRYVQHGDLRPDNNLAENAIRPFVIGRKNWLFSDTENGANASAALYSLIETAKANGLEPHAYMLNVIEKIPNAKSLDDFNHLLPYKNNS